MAPRKLALTCCMTVSRHVVTFKNKTDSAYASGTGHGAYQEPDV